MSAVAHAYLRHEHWIGAPHVVARACWKQEHSYNRYRALLGETADHVPQHLFERLMRTLSYCVWQDKFTLQLRAALTLCREAAACWRIHYNHREEYTVGEYLRRWN